MPKLVVLGGSSIASPELITALAKGAPDDVFEVTLVGRSAEKLERVGRVCAALATTTPRQRVTWTTDLPRALEGAQFVLNQIRVGGLHARSFDESFPHPFNIPGEETVGPGGFANALRTIPQCMDFARAVERYAPDAWFLNLTNPASMIQAALAQTTQVRVVSICDSPVSLCEQVAALVGVPVQELEFDYLGMLHFGWIVGLTHKSENLMPLALEHIAQLPGLLVDARMVQAIGAIPHPYLNYLLAPDVMLARQRAKGHTRAQELDQLEVQILDDYALGSVDKIKQRAAVWYDKIVAPVLHALMRGGQAIVNVPNGGSVPWLPPDTVIETRCQITPQGLTPDVAAPAPREVQAMVQQNAAYEALAVEAILEDSYETAWRALRMNPLVASTDQARALLDVIWATRGFPTD